MYLRLEFFNPPFQGFAHIMSKIYHDYCHDLVSFPWEISNKFISEAYNKLHMMVLLSLADFCQIWTLQMRLYTEKYRGLAEEQ